MRKVLLACAAGAAMLWIPVANAGPIKFEVYSGSALIGSGSSALGTLNAFTTPMFLATDGHFQVSGNAVGYPASKSPNLSTNTFTLSTDGSAGQITIKVTDINLTAFSGNIANGLTINSTAGGGFTSGSVADYFDASNLEFGTATMLSTLSVNGLQAASDNRIVSANFTQPFSETAIYVFNFGPGQAFTSVTAGAQITEVPEPASLALVGAGLACLGLVRRLRRG